jgi:hypothetical protein
MFSIDKAISPKEKKFVEVVTFFVTLTILLAVLYVISFGVLIRSIANEYNSSKDIERVGLRSDQLHFWYAPILIPARKKHNDRYRGLVTDYALWWAGPNWLLFISPED